ncbi:EAL domain-containing protein [Clostridium weizhouense]|uniref:EAL domain-containing protein n=1 Tax=Clostridium weizhouense TaxID=2859781 RepID=A0ABS7ASG6_9CLOT|nr:EAL domain-containing protein [Clostridium weizhouense]MBW6410596.1 EAL domain-containing protein [Clostridium weizhouense]
MDKIKENPVDFFRKKFLKLQRITNNIDAGIATISYNKLLTISYANDGFFKLFGFSHEEFASKIKNKFTSIVFKDDLPLLLNKLSQIQSTSEEIKIELRAYKKDNSIFWLLIKGHCIKLNETEKQFLFVFVDITETKKVQQELKIAKTHYKIIAEQCDNILFEYLIPNDTMIYSSKYINITGNKPVIRKFKETILKSDYIYKDDIKIFLSLIEEILSGKNFVSADLRIKSKAGTYIWIKIQATTIFDFNNKPVKSIGKVLNIDKEKKEYFNLKLETQLDPLTKLYNKTVSKSLIDDYLTTQDIKTTHAFMIIDIDNFKSVNDNLGHIFGDSVLSKIALNIKKPFNNYDIIGRIGGDEFIIFLKNVSCLDYIYEKATSICNIFKNTYTGENKTHKISCSIGISLYPNHGNNYDELLKKADYALYKAKQHGKDCFEIYTEGIIYNDQFKKDNLVNSNISTINSSLDNTLKDNLIDSKLDISFTSKDKLLSVSDMQNVFEVITSIDPLTGLMNLSKFEVVANNLLNNNLQKNKYALIYSDFNKFKYINDNLGYAIGNELLIKFSNLLSDSLEKDELLCRPSSDNFITLIKYNGIKNFKNRLASFNEKFIKIQKQDFNNLKLSVISGICLISSYNNNLYSIIDKANMARKTIKDSHKSQYAFYDKKLHIQSTKEKKIESLMVTALENKEFLVYLQPKVELLTKKTVGAEALVRWLRPNKTLIAPGEFIPLFEKNGFIIELDFYVYEEIFKTIRRWIDEDKNIFPISVNVSRAHINDNSFIYRLNKLIEKYKIPTNLIELELTENICFNNMDNVINQIIKLKLLGFSFSIDDFGSGYSSLNLLKDIPIDVLKLDKSFFPSNNINKKEKIIVSNIVNMAKDLDILVLSEGIETQEQIDFLTNIGCNLVQGYYFAKPMPIEEFEKIYGIKSNDS